MKRIYLYAYGLSGGNGLNVVRIANHLLRKGWEVSLIYNKVDQRCLSLCEPKLIHHKLSDDGLVRAVFQIRRLIKNLKTPTVYFVSGGSYAFVFTMAVQLAFKKAPLVIRECVSPSLMIPKTARFYNLKKKLLSYAYKKADTLVAITKAMQMDMEEAFHADSKKISVIYNGVEFLSEDTTEPISSNTADNDKTIRLLNIGRLVAQKNQILLLDAFAQLDKRFVLDIVGEGPEREVLEKRSRKLGVKDRVTFHGYQSNVSQFYQVADVFVLSSDFEGFPNVLVEALYHGCQVVSTSCPTGPDEILDNGRYGKIVPCRDATELTKAIKEIVKNPFEVEKLKARACNFTVANQVQQFEKICNEMAI